jgi:propionate CoA-transferase
VTYRLVSPDDVADLIPCGATVVSDGFTMMSVADEIYAQIERSFVEKGHPNGLTWVHAAGQSNRLAGLARIAHAGLVKRVVGPHWGLNPPMADLLGSNAVECVCLPQGQISTLYRTIAAGRPGQLSSVGLGTFVDPRVDGGRLNDLTKQNVAADEYVEIVNIDGREYLRYKPFAMNVGIIRGSRIDSFGNMSQEDDATILDSLAIAQAVHNQGGIVIAQVKEIVKPGDIMPRLVNVPGVLIDYVMVCSDPSAYHRQSSGFVPVDMNLISGYATPQNVESAMAAAEISPERTMIGNRGVELVHPGDIINLGTGIPGDTIGVALAREKMLDRVTLTVESGIYGGIPLGGVDFGCALHPQAIISHPAQFDFYNGGGVDITFMGVGQVDGAGNVNVSAFAGKAVGCGGFMDIVDGAKRVCFLMKSKAHYPKWVERVDQLTFNGAASLDRGQEVFLCTEYYTLQLERKGWVVRSVDASATAREALALARLEQL